MYVCMSRLPISINIYWTHYKTRSCKNICMYGQQFAVLIISTVFICAYYLSTLCHRRGPDCKHARSNWYTPPLSIYRWRLLGRWRDVERGWYLFIEWYRWWCISICIVMIIKMNIYLIIWDNIKRNLYQIFDIYFFKGQHQERTI